MLRMTRLVWATLAGCAASTGATTLPAESPPAATDTAQAEPPTGATLTPAPGVASLQLVCRDVERANGVDDDCDGHIDEDVGGTPSALELTLTWSGPARLTLEAAPAHAPRGAPECAPNVACTVRLTDDAWQREPLDVRVARDAGSDGPDTLTASLCAAGHGTSLGCHNVTLARGESREVARLSAR